MSEEIRESTLALIGRVVYYFSNLEAALFEFTTSLTLDHYVEAILARESFSKLQDHFITVLHEYVRVAQRLGNQIPDELKLLDEARKVMRTVDNVKDRRNKLLHGRLNAYFALDRPTLRFTEDPTVAMGSRRVRATSKAREKGYDTALDKWTPGELATLAEDILAALNDLRAFHFKVRTRSWREGQSDPAAEPDGQ